MKSAVQQLATNFRHRDCEARIAHWAVKVDEKPQVGVAYIICIPGPHIRLVNGPRVDLQCAMSTPALTLSQSPRLRLNASCYIFDIPPYAPPSPTHM